MEKLYASPGLPSSKYSSLGQASDKRLDDFQTEKKLRLAIFPNHDRRCPTSRRSLLARCGAPGFCLEGKA
jgi:hypothetical protein